MGCLTFLSPCSQLQEAEVRNRDLEAHVRQLQERMEMLQAPGAAGESHPPQASRAPGEDGGALGVWTLGAGEGPRLGHAEPPPSSALHAPSTSLLLPAVMGVPSPWATDPPSHVRPPSSPSHSHLLPTAQPPPSAFRARPPCGLQRKTPFAQPASASPPSLQALSPVLPRGTS